MICMIRPAEALMQITSIEINCKFNDLVKQKSHNNIFLIDALTCTGFLLFLFLSLSHLVFSFPV